MGKRILADELGKIAMMVKGKINRDGGFTAFVITYSERGNYLAQIEPGVTELERTRAFGQLADWIKQQSPYMFVFGVQTLRPKGIEKDGAILLIAKTPEQTKKLSMKYIIQENKYIYTEDMTDEVSECDGYLDKVYRGIQ